MNDNDDDEWWSYSSTVINNKQLNNYKNKQIAYFWFFDCHYYDSHNYKFVTKIEQKFWFQEWRHSINLPYLKFNRNKLSAIQIPLHRISRKTGFESRNAWCIYNSGITSQPNLFFIFIDYKFKLGCDLRHLTF